MNAVVELEALAEPKPRRKRKPKVAVEVKVEAPVEVAPPEPVISPRELLEDLRKNGKDLFRCGTIGPQGNLIDKSYGEICSAPYRYGKRNAYNYKRRVYVDSPPLFAEGNTFVLSYNGESPADSGHPEGMTEGGELSLAWLKFILDPNESPWKNVLPCISNIGDIEWINEKGGFIFENFHEMGGNLFGGFLIATRMAQENNYIVKHWHKLVSEGMHPRFAFLVACSCTENGKAVMLGIHTPLSSSVGSWGKNCWDLNSNDGDPIGKNGFTGGNQLYHNPKITGYGGYGGKQLVDNESPEYTIKTLLEICELKEVPRAA